MQEATYISIQTSAFTFELLTANNEFTWFLGNNKSTYNSTHICVHTDWEQYTDADLIY